MRRASSRFIPHLRNHTKTSYSLFSRDFITHPINDLKPTQKTQSLLFTHPKSLGFHQKFNTLVDPTPPLSSRQRKLQEKSNLDDAFESAESSEDMLKAFKEMEPVFTEYELGLAALKMGLKLDQEGEDPEQTLSYAKRALNSLDQDGKSTLPLAMTLQLLGSVSFTLKKFNDSLGYLIRANRALVQLEKEGSWEVNDIMPVMHAVQLELSNVKTAMGRREEAISNLKRALEIKEIMLEENSKELGIANRDVAEAYVAVLNFKEGLPFCLKALEIHKQQLGSNSVEVAHDRRLLGVIYTGLDDHEKALEQNQLSQKVLKSWGLNSDLLRAEIDAANMQIALDRYDEAIDTLKRVVQETGQDSEDRAMVYISMAKALSNMENFNDAKRCLEISCTIFNKMEKDSPVNVAEAYIEISMQYETMNEFEKAIILLKKALSMIEKIPEEQHSVGSVSARIGWILLLTGKVELAIPYLENAAERLKESFGSKHFGVGYVYNNLGAAYLELDRPQSAAQVFAYAKDIMDVSLGPNHADTIESCANLSKAYAAMGSNEVAIKFQEKVIEAWESHGASAEDELKEACRILEELKRKVDDALSKELLKSMSSMQNQKVISDGK